MTKEERLAIKTAIWRFYADGGEKEFGKFGRFIPYDCKYIRLPDGRSFVIENGHIFTGKKPDGRTIWDDEIANIILTEEDIYNAKLIPCPECPVFKNCHSVDYIVEEFKKHYGCPKSVETVEAIHHFMLEKRKQEGSCDEKQRQPLKEELRAKLASYLIDCPFCGARLEIPGEVNNTTAKCPTCNEEIYLTKEDALEDLGSNKNGNFRIECPFCQTKLEVPDGLDNTTVHCPACNEELFLTKEDSIS